MKEQTYEEGCLKQNVKNANAGPVEIIWWPCPNLNLDPY
jgi:hypothetical protein